MNVLLVGLNHRTAPVEIREQLAFSRDGVATALLLFRNQFPGSEAAILSTCNRVEMLVASESDSPTLKDVISFIAQARDLPARDFAPYLYQLSGEAACRHLFRVASGLDSMVLGESQIVSQIKQAYAAASEQGTTGRLLNRLFHHAFQVSKRVRTETRVGEGKCSVSSVAVDIAGRIFEDFASKEVLVMGAGEMAQLVCQSLKDASVRKFTVTTRTLLNAKALAEACEGRYVPFAEADAELQKADIVVTATACPEPILTPERVMRAQKLRRGRPLFLIDLAVPRNVHADVAKLENVYLYDIDALGRIVAENQQQRCQQLELCEKILDQEVNDFEDWVRTTRVNPLIEQMYKDARSVRDAEVLKALHRLPGLTDEQRHEIEKLADRLVGKFMHPCVMMLRKQGLGGWSAAGEDTPAAARNRRGGRPA